MGPKIAEDLEEVLAKQLLHPEGTTDLKLVHTLSRVIALVAWMTDEEIEKLSERATKGWLG